MKYLFLLLICFNAYSQEIMESELKRCNSNFTLNPYLRDELNLKSEKMSTLLFEAPLFCECVVKKREEELKFKDKDFFSWLFIGKSNRLEKEDLCAQEKFSEANRLKYFYLVFGLEISEYIYEELEDFYHRGVKGFATAESYKEHLLCINKSITSSCLKTQSSLISYKCVQENIKDANLVYEKAKDCPDFKTVQLINF